MEDVFGLAYRYVAPSVRRVLADKLVEKGMSRKEAAEMLGLSRSAVTRYLKSERGVLAKITGFEDVTRRIEEVSERVLRGELDEYSVQEEVSKIAAYFMSKKYFCKTHKKMDPEIDIARCRVCSRVFGENL